MPNHDPSYLAFKGRYKPLRNHVGKYPRFHAETLYAQARPPKSNPVILYASNPEKFHAEDMGKSVFLCLGMVLAGIIFFMIA